MPWKPHGYWLAGHRNNVSVFYDKNVAKWRAIYMFYYVC